MVAVAMAMFLRQNTGVPEHSERLMLAQGFSESAVDSNQYVCQNQLCEHRYHSLRPRSRVKNLVVGTLSMGCLTENSLRMLHARTGCVLESSNVFKSGVFKSYDVIAASAQQQIL